MNEMLVRLRLPNTLYVFMMIAVCVIPTALFFVKLKLRPPTYLENGIGQHKMLGMVRLAFILRLLLAQASDPSVNGRAGMS